MQVDVFIKKKKTSKAWQGRACVKMDSKYMIYQGHVNYSITEDFSLKTAWRVDCSMKRGCILCKGSNLLWHDTCVSVRTAHIVKSLKHSLLCIRQMLAVGSALHGSILLNNQLKLRFRIARRCSVKKALVKLLQHSEENTCAMRPATLLNKRLSHSYFSLDFAKFLRTPFLMEHLW